MKGILAASVKTLLILYLAFAAAVALADIIAVPAQQRPGQQGLFKAAQMGNVSTALGRAFSEYRVHVNQGRPTAFVPSDRFLPFSSGRILIEARATGSSADLLNDLSQLGLQNGSRYGPLVSGLLPVAAIGQAAALSSMRYVSAALPPIRNTGLVNSQGDIALRADLARSAFGVDGSGVTVGVLSDSYDTLGGAALDVSTNDLPTGGVQVIGGESVYCGTVIFCIDEGRAMLQIVYDMAPGADLLFHTGLATKTDYANGITALAAAGADVIVDDLLYLHEPMFQDGVVAQAVDSVVAGGAVYYSAAGNAGHESYEAAFVDSNIILCIEFFLPLGDCHPLYERVGRMHDFDPAPGPGKVDVVQTVTVPVNRVLTVAMQWDEPFGGAGPRTDHDVVLLSPDGGVYYAISANDNIPMGEGWEVLQFENSEFLYNGETTYGLAITYDDVDSVGPPANLVKLVVFGSGNTIDEHRTYSSTLYGHANAAGAEAVGAAFFEDTPEFNTNPPLLEPYSSKGGTPILFNSNGSPKGTPENRLKPEITAVDGVHTTFFFNDATGDGFDDFFGTSAAAPHAAGIAALMLHADSNATPAQVNAALESSAIDMNAQGFDFESGYGLIQADAAIAALGAPPGGNNPPTAAFTYGMSALIVDFTDMSSDSDGSVMEWSWNFGDSNGSTAQSPVHTYPAEGNYTVILTVTDNEDVSDSTSQLVSVSAGGSGNAAPVANFSYTCNGKLCTFNSASTDSDGTVDAWDWDFDDGGDADLADPVHEYGSQGNYTVTLMVTDDDGDTGSVSASFRVKNRGSTSGSTGGGDSGGDTGGDTGGTEKGRKKCNDGLDNDGDGAIDGLDPDCA
jgi:PKD repeat protein